jgi:hypothetical protein
MLMDQRVVSYLTIEDELFVQNAAYSDIVGFTVISQGGFREDTVVGIQTASSENFIVLASPEGDGDKRFLAGLESRIGGLEDSSPL